MDLDIKYLGLESLSKIGSTLGISIKTDKYTKEKTMLRYARLLIEIQLEDVFREYIEFINDRSVLVRQKVEYEWKPTKCCHCKMFGHVKEECSKKTQVRKEWRVIQRQVEQEPLNTPSQVQRQLEDVEGFVTV